MPYHELPVAVIDNGGQWTHREWRVLNYLGAQAEIVPNTTPVEALARFRALVLSGGAPRIGGEAGGLGRTAEYLDAGRWPVLGICVGHQFLVTHYGGAAGPAATPEYGHAALCVADHGWLLAGLPDDFSAWESHNDEVTELPGCFRLLASSSACRVQAVEHHELPYAGVQYHPEVEHTEHGAEVFTNFLRRAVEWDGPLRPHA